MLLRISRLDRKDMAWTGEDWSSDPVLALRFHSVVECTTYCAENRVSGDIIRAEFQLFDHHGFCSGRPDRRDAAGSPDRNSPSPPDIAPCKE